MTERLPRTNLVPHLDEDNHAGSLASDGHDVDRRDESRERALEEVRQRKAKAKREKDDEIRRYREGKDRVPVGMTTYFGAKEWSGGRPSGRRKLVPAVHMTKGGKHKMEVDDLARGRKHFARGGSGAERRGEEGKDEEDRWRAGRRVRGVGRQPAPWEHESEDEQHSTKQAQFKT